MQSTDHLLLIHEIIEAARANLDEPVWDYLVGGAESETTARRNRQAIDSVALRPRVLRDVSNVDCSATLLGGRMRIPVLLAPIGSLQDLYPGGGATVAKAAAAFGVPMMLSSVSEPGLEATASAAKGRKIFQLYVRGDAAWVDAHLRRAIEHGYEAFCLTVDLDYYSHRERDVAKRYVTTARRTVADGQEHQQRFGWDDVKRIKDTHDIPLMLKGIATGEDAALACAHGVEVVYVSNHGGRQLDHGRGALEVLPEVVAAVAGRAEIVVDGGFLRGTDVVKALALGANAVGVGRLLGFGIAAAGAAGIVRVLELLEEEIRATLGLLGVCTLAALDQSYVHAATPVSPPTLNGAFPLLDVD